MNTEQIPNDQEIDRRLRSIRSAVLTEVGRTTKRTRNLRIGIAGAAALLVGLGATGGAVAVKMATQDEIQHNVACYSAPSLTAPHVDVTVADGYNVNSGAKLVGDADPVALCEQSWKAGTIGQATIPADPNTAKFPVPALQFCTLRTGIIAGFPTGDASFCDNVGLTTWLP
ncbi:hypothetical protein [Curtobacterium sp. KBS0715]|uniref:hypothetical protein n=1 Tax=Curtobacterium sp. KBS0715 TaxID=1179671 RepID=UPI00110F1B79|nr:hypothetical protein [Curtobacterium sp. KBS0715]TSD11632.1 hypothetical protein FFG40_008845 [Curtobacterium sp. KBS0715]